MSEPDVPGYQARIEPDLMARFRAPLDPGPPRCWSCGHPWDAECGCLCCTDSHEGDPDAV